jgi:hypothetical protein
MTGHEEGAVRTFRSLLLEETSAMPVDSHQAGVRLRRQLGDIRRRRRLALAVAVSVVVAVAVTVAGGRLGINKAGEPAQNPDQPVAVAPVAVAQEFLDAVGRFDADTAISYLTEDADVQGDSIAAGSDAAEQLRLTLAHDQAEGYQQTIKDCVQVGTSVPGWMVAGPSVSCAFDFQTMRSGEIGFDPYTDNAWRLTVRDGKIVWANQVIPHGTNGFLEQMDMPFGSWMSLNHPDDLLTMYADKQGSDVRYTEDSNRLWEQRTAEYAAVVKQNPAALLHEPEVAAYVARLDSICAAAQARVKEEIQAIPQQNQTALIEARNRNMLRTIFDLRALVLPEAVRWPYEGRAFPLMEKFYRYPHNVQPPESLQLQIEQIPGLNKCVFPV